MVQEVTVQTACKVPSAGWVQWCYWSGIQHGMVMEDWLLLCVCVQESQLEDERSKNERLTEEAELLRRKAQLLEQVSGTPNMRVSVYECVCASRYCA